jgi:hypothetical protein
MTGIIALNSGEYDYGIVEQLVETICRKWDQHCSAHYGFKVFVSPSAFKKFYEAGIRILEENFPLPPGPFKRVASLIVISQMYPFFHFEPELTLEASHRWRAKMTALLMPVGLAKLRVNLTPDEANPTWQRLDAWYGFPSDHFKMEFLQFLERIDTCHWWEKTTIEGGLQEQISERIITEETVRLINSTALMLEACYYWNEEWNHFALRLRGKCNDFFDGSDPDVPNEFYYDYEIYKGAQSH